MECEESHEHATESRNSKRGGRYSATNGGNMKTIYIDNTLAVSAKLRNLGRSPPPRNPTNTWSTGPVSQTFLACFTCAPSGKLGAK